MAVAARPIGYEDRLSTVEHLSELRVRLFVCLGAIAIAFGLCMWQNHALLHIVNRPLERQTQKQVRAGEGPLGATYVAQQGSLALARQVSEIVAALERPGSGASQATRGVLASLRPQLGRTISRLDAPPQGEKPVTLGIGEPFTATIAVALIFAVILASPIILYELYGFLLPAFSPGQQRLATPLTVAVPFLFAAGVAFGYFVVLPAAVRFFENFNSGQFNVLVQASQYYHFAALTLLAMGLVFQVPLAIVAITSAGVLTTRQLRRNRRYAILLCGAVAALLPSDAVTMLLETVPLYLLFELGLLGARLLEWRSRRRPAPDVA